MAPPGKRPASSRVPFSEVPARVRRVWRRSLQFRVVAITMLLGVVVLTLTLSYVYQQIASGMVNERRQLAANEALQLTRALQLKFDATDRNQSADELTTAAISFVQEIAGTERSRYVVLSRLAGNTSTFVIPTVVSGEIREAQIPEELRRAVAGDARTQQIQVVSVKLTGIERPVPSFVVGQQVQLRPGGPYGVYYVFPMERERQTLDVVGRTLLGGGLVLTLLIGAVAFVVARLVVDPVRQAAQVAERLAAGRLTERMISKGEDDLASLATSFNAMADGLQRQIGQLEDLSLVQQRFVSDVSHELRTPLTTIRMAVDLIHGARAGFEPAVARSAELLLGELDRFEALLTDLLEISRFDAGAAVLDVEHVDLRGTVAKVVTGVATLAAARGSRITVVDPGAPCEAVYDSRRIERVLRNLVVNAVEHGEGRPVEVRLGANDHAVAVAVRDHGVGLQPGEAGMVFDRFWRADPARARTTGGTGLGLSIALEDTRLHEGWLQAWGAPGAGSCFRLTLPRDRAVPIESSPVPLAPDGDSVPVTSAVR